MDLITPKILPSNYTTVMAHARLVNNEIFIPPSLLIRLVAESNTLTERMFCMQLLRTISRTAVVDAMNVAYPGMFWTWTKRETSDPFLTEVTDFINHMNALISFHIPINQKLSRPDIAMTSINQKLPRPDIAMTSINQKLPRPDIAMTSINQRITGSDIAMTSINQKLPRSDIAMTPVNQRITGSDISLTPVNQRLTGSDISLTPINQRPLRRGAASDSPLMKSCLKAKPVKYKVMSEDREKTNKIRFKGSEVKLFEWDPDERGSGEKRNFSQLTNIREDRNFKQIRKRMMREAKQELRLHYCYKHPRNK